MISADTKVAHRARDKDSDRDHAKQHRSTQNNNNYIKCITTFIMHKNNAGIRLADSMAANARSARRPTSAELQATSNSRKHKPKSYNTIYTHSYRQTTDAATHFK